MKTAPMIPQRKLAGIKIPVDHAGRWKLATCEKRLTNAHFHDMLESVPVESPHRAAQDYLPGVPLREYAFSLD
jgi:hypothetical protein